MGYKYLKFTSPGSEKKYNEDAVEIVETGEGILAILCDGVGGDYGGDLASRIALKSALYFFTSSNSNDYLDRIKMTIADSNNFILNHSSSSAPLKGMATTFEILFIKDSFVYWGHIGDSRIYHFKSKRLNQLTKDHSLVQKLLDEGFITPKQAENHPQKNVIIKALGNNDNPESDISKIRMSESEQNKFFICSDGISNLITNREIEEVLNLNELEEIKNRIVKLVKQRGEVDDYSFIIIEVKQ
jgi:PPM family protein phosphatase